MMKSSEDFNSPVPQEIDAIIHQLRQEKEALDKLLRFLEQRNQAATCEPAISESREHQIVR